jgi:hypothetical protein
MSTSLAVTPRRDRMPGDCQVNRAKRYTDLQKRTSLTSETVLGGRCELGASSLRYRLSTRQDSNLP